MTEIAWVGPSFTLAPWPLFVPAMALHGDGGFLEMEHGDIFASLLQVCLLTDGTVCESWGWKRYVERIHEPNAKASSLGHPDSYMTIVHPFCTPIPGPTIATAHQLGGEAWLEWLRGEGLL